MHHQQADPQTILMSGATGFIGRELLPRLLEGGRRVIALVRAADDREAKRRLSELLGGKRLDPNLRIVAGELAAPGLGLSPTAFRRLAEETESIVNVAGCTLFEATPEGEPFRTNVDGVRELLAFARLAKAPIHHFSTAFVCGDRAGLCPEDAASFGEPRNVYEASKQQGEELLRAALETGELGGLTRYRPTITISDPDSAEMQCGHGLQQFLRNLKRIASRIESRDPSGRLPILIDGRHDDPVHLAPVGWVADAFAKIFNRPALHGGVWHLALKRPPTAAQFRLAIEQHLGIEIEGFTESSAARREDEMNPTETLFYRLCRPIRPYISQKMRFACDRMERDPELQSRAEMPFDARWWPAVFGPVNVEPLPCPVPQEPFENAIDPGCRDYFESWLPERAPDSRVGQMSSLDLDVGFRIERGGDWTCSFREGRLTGVRRGVVEAEVRTGFDVQRKTFLDVVAGKQSPQAAFFKGEAEIFGDVEAGLKFAMILQQFVEEHPWDGAAFEAFGLPLTA